MRFLQKSSLPLKHMFMLFLFAVMANYSLSSQASSTKTIEERIDFEVEKIVGKLIDEKEYISIVSLKGQSTSGEPTKDLPFSSVKINQKLLDSLLNKSTSNLIQTANFEIEIYFNETVPKDKVELIVKKLTSKLAIDGTNRTIVSEVRPIYSANEDLLKIEALKLEQQILENQKSKLENEKNQVELERTRLENENSLQKVQQEIQALQQKEKDMRDALSKQKQDFDLERQKIQDDIANQSNPLNLAKDFQLLLVAVAMGIVLLITTLLLSGAHKKAFGGISNAMQALGDSLAAKSQTSDSAAGDIPTTDTESTTTSQNIKNEIAVESNPIEDKRVADFLNLVEEKVAVLSAEGNLNFYKHYIDLIDSNPTYAASILVSVDAKIAKVLVEKLSPEYIARIQNYLEEPESMAKAQSARKPALQAFFGRIAVDEFIDSPIASIKDVDWLTRLSNQEMQELSLSLNDSLRSVFFASLTPSRLASIIKSTKVEGDQQTLISTLKELTQIDGSGIEEKFSEIKTTWKNLNSSKVDTTRNLINGPRFIAEVMQEVSPLDRKKILKTLEDQLDLVEDLKKYYIPFDEVKHLTETTVKNIFGSRSISQLATMLFTSDKETKDVVLASLDEVLRETAIEEIAVIQADDDNNDTNELKSYKLQDEVCLYMLKLNANGLLKYKSKDVKQNQGQSNAA